MHAAMKSMSGVTWEAEHTQGGPRASSQQALLLQEPPGNSSLPSPIPGPSPLQPWWSHCPVCSGLQGFARPPSWARNSHVGCPGRGLVALDSLSQQSGRDDDENGAGAELQEGAGSPGLSRSWGGHPASLLCPAGIDTGCHVLARERWAKATFPEIAACTQCQPGSSPALSHCGTGGD